MKQEQLLRFFSFRRILIPLIIGFSVTFFLIYKDSSETSFLTIIQNLGEQWSFRHSFYIFLCFACIAARDVAYMYRIRILTDKKLSWKKSFQVIMLWEFASSLTPSVVGGSAVALYIVSKEKIPAGKSTAIVMITALLDELFYILAVPIFVLSAGGQNVFNFSHAFSLFGQSISLSNLFYIGYGFIVILTLSILYAVFIKPLHFKQILSRLFSIKILSRWKHHIEQWGMDLIETSHQMKNKKASFWAKVFSITSFSWLARFFMLNCLLMFINTESIDNFVVMARQLIMWVVLLISPTPGGSGVAEYAMPLFLGEFIPEGLGSYVAVLWRLFSYYPYIIIGAFVLPIWVKRVYAKKTKEEKF